MTVPEFFDRPPASPKVTDYDEQHFITYLRLLDADVEGADWREVASIVFDLDVAAAPAHAELVHQSHLERARWMTTHGYRDLLEKAR